MITAAVIYLFFPGILLYYFWASWFGDLLVIIFIICFIYLIVSSAFSFGGGKGKSRGGLGGEEGIGGGEIRTAGTLAIDKEIIRLFSIVQAKHCNRPVLFH